MKNFPHRLRYVRHLRELSQTELARACKLTQSAISNYENGIRHIPREILTLAHCLDVRPEWLKTGKGNMHRDPIKPLLHENQAHYASLQTWPFETIAPQEINALPTEKRQELEHVLRYVLLGMQHEQN